MRRLGTALLLSVLLAACGAKPAKDDPNAGAGTTEQVPAPDDFVVQDVETEAMPDADSLSGEVAAGSGEVSAGVASDIEGAIRAADKGNFDKAVRKLSSLVDRPDGGFLAAYNLAIVHERQGLYEKAAKRYFQSLQQNADFTPALENLVRLYLRGGQAADAERLARRFVDARPENLGHRAVMLHIELQRGKHEDVIRTAKQLLLKDERHVGAMYAMAEANYELGRYELARSIVDTAVELRPERADLYYTAGLIALALDDKVAARTNFEKAIALREQFPEARNNLGVIYQEARDYAAGTYVVRDRVPLRLPPPPTMPPPLATWARHTDLATLPTGTALAVRQFLNRAHTLDPAAREQVGAELLADVLPHVAPAPPSGHPASFVLAAIVAERRERDLARLKRDDDLRARLLRAP